MLSVGNILDDQWVNLPIICDLLESLDIMNSHHIDPSRRIRGQVFEELIGLGPRGNLCRPGIGAKFQHLETEMLDQLFAYKNGCARWQSALLRNPRCQFFSAHNSSRQAHYALQVGKMEARISPRGP